MMAAACPGSKTSPSQVAVLFEACWELPFRGFPRLGKVTGRCSKLGHSKSEDDELSRQEHAPQACLKLLVSRDFWREMDLEAAQRVGAKAEAQGIYLCTYFVCDERG